jgi:voltage-gated potassium channel
MTSPGMNPNPKAGAEQSGPIAFVHRWLFDFEHPGGFAARLDYLIAVLILVSVGAIILEQVEPIFQPYSHWFHLLDWALIAVFSLEYLLRWATAPFEPQFKGSKWPRLRYLVSFYALIDLLAIAPAYAALVVGFEGEALIALRMVRLLRVFKLGRHLVPAWHDFQALNRHRSFRGKLHALLEPTGHSGRLHAYVDNFVITWVVLSIISVILQSMHDVEQLFAREFKIIDTIAFTIFIVEYAARVYCAPESPALKGKRWVRWHHVRSPSALIDLVAILPTLVEWLIPNTLDLRFLRIFRLLQLLKLTRYTAAAVTLYKVITRERQVIVAAGFVMLLLVVLTASMGYIFEHDAQPDKFENIPQAIYWAVITLASVGYGDISPVTPMGRALTVVLALIGIGIFAIPAGLLASAFTDQLRLDREEFKRRLLHAYEGGESAARARALIATEADRLHLSEDDIRRLTAEARSEFEARQREAHESARAVVIDPARHPALACDQLRLLASQLNLLVSSAGPDLLREQVEKASNVSSDERESLISLIALARGGNSQSPHRGGSGG